MRKSLLIAFVLLAVKSNPALAGTVSVSGPLTDDASTLISSSATYTHKVSGGAAATVNGVVFDVLTATAAPANFAWTSPTKDQIGTNNPGDWLPATGGVTGPGLVSLLNNFTYAPQGAGPGASQTFALSGLVAGTTYDLRLYIRLWDTEGSGRPIAFTVTHGAEVNAFAGLEDRPGTVLGTGNDHHAYYVNYNYTAQASELTITAAVPDNGAADSGSFHLYGLTNQVAAIPEPTAVALALGGIAMGLRRRRRA